MPVARRVCWPSLPFLCFVFLTSARQASSYGDNLYTRPVRPWPGREATCNHLHLYDEVRTNMLKHKILPLLSPLFISSSMHEATCWNRELGSMTIVYTQKTLVT